MTAVKSSSEDVISRGKASASHRMQAGVEGVRVERELVILVQHLVVRGQLNAVVPHGTVNGRSLTDSQLIAAGSGLAEAGICRTRSVMEFAHGGRR